MSIIENSHLNGLPGIGATGQRGNIGKKGQNVLFGYIEDFFDKEVVTIDPYVYYASRTIENEVTYYEGKKGQVVSDYISYVVQGAKLPSPNSNDVASKIKLSESPKEIVVPTVFSSSISSVGDLIYIVEMKSSGQMFIKYMMVVTEPMFGKTFVEIIENFILQEDPTVIRSFYMNSDRMIISEMYSPLRYELSSVIDSSLSFKYRENFADSVESKYAQIISEYSEDNKTYIQQFLAEKSSMDIILKDNSFVFSENTLKVPQLYINNDCVSDIPLQNVILPKKISFSSLGFIPSISENDVDVLKGTLKVSLSKFLSIVDSIDEWSYGVEIHAIDSSISEIVEYDFSQNAYGEIDILPLVPEGKSRHKVLTYIAREGGTRYYGRPSIMTIEKTWLKDFEKFILEAYSIEDGDSYLSEDVNSGDTDYVDFTLDPLNYEKSSGINFVVNAREGFYIDTIAFNSIPVFKDDKDNITNFSEDENLWFSIDNVSGENNNKTYTLSFDDNLPNIGEIHPTTLEEYLSVYGEEKNYQGTSELFKYLETKTRTLSRIVLVTVITKASKDSEGKKSYYKIIQPGFTDNRKKPSLSIVPRIYNNDLENSNNAENGVLCNQFQYFLDLKIQDFDLNTWGQYKKDAKIDVTLKLDQYNQIKSSNKGTLVNNYNLCIYDKSFLNSFQNNAFRIRLDYIADPKITYSDTIRSLEEASNQIKISVINKNGEEIHPTSVNVDGSIYESDWYYLNDFNYNEISFRLDDAILKDLACGAKPGKLRVLFEYANPIPSELNMNIVVERICIHYESNGKEMYFPLEMFEFIESEQGNYTKYEVESSNKKFIFNPLYLTVANESSEELVALSYKPALYKTTGSIKETSVDLGLYGYGIINDKRKVESERDRQVNYFNYTDYFFKVKDLQDNIKSLYVVPADIKDVKNQNKISKDNDFLKIIDLQVSEKAASYNYESFVDDERVNKFDPNSYLSVIYNSNIMLPKKEGSESILTYNDEEYDGRNYAQFENNAPLFLNQSFNLQVRSDEEVAAISGWNYEYEISKDYNKDFTIGGYTTLSGNGYLSLPVNQYKGMYSPDEIMPLEELVEEQNQEVFNKNPYEDNIQSSSISDDYIPMPGKYWRVPVWNMNWMLPIYKYDKLQNINYIIPYRFTNPYVSFFDRIVTENLLEGKDYNAIIANFGKITASYKMTLFINDFLDTDGHSIVINAKYNNFDCVKLLNVLTKTDYNSDSIDDYDVNSLVNDVIETNPSYEELTSTYQVSTDIPNNIIRWWICTSSLKNAIEYPETYDVNISQKEYEDFKIDLLTLAYSEESEKSEEEKNFKFNLNEYEKYTKKESSSESRNNFIPYNLLYSVYPRIAYPEDKEKVNVLMIQQPSISSPEKYKMYKHYFSTTNYTDVFPDLPEPYQCLL